MAELGKKFDGAATCGRVPRQDRPQAPARPPHDRKRDLERQGQARHRVQGVAKAAAGRSCQGAGLADIGKKLGIAKVEKEAKCLACHAVNVPEALRGRTFRPRGRELRQLPRPQRRLERPAQEQGLDQRTAHRRRGRRAKTPEAWPGENAHMQLLKTTGLYDTKPVVARAEICVSCHLAIDPKMVAAGHPQPFFELNKFTADEPPHWRERTDEAGLGHTRTWAVGQIVCMRDSMLQLADRAKNGADAPALKDALAQALAHYSMVKILVDAKAIDAGSAALDKGA